jgi:hypothetical protein
VPLPQPWRRNSPLGAVMARKKTHQVATPPAADTSTLAQGKSKRWRPRELLCDLHFEKYGVRPSPRSLERWPLAWRYANGFAVADEDEFLVEAARRFDARPPVRSGRSHGNKRTSLDGVTAEQTERGA